MTASVGVSLVALGVLLAGLAIGCIHLISSARAYVAGESEWSKAQKSATLALMRYTETRAEADWAQYTTAMAVPLGDRRAREAMEAPDLDVEAARAGLLAGRNHPDDVDGMIRLFRWFRDVPFMDRTIAIWTEADALVEDLSDLATRMRAAADRHDRFVLEAIKARLLSMEERFTPLEQRFSATLGDASRTTQRLMVGVMLGGTLLLTGLAIAVLRLGARQARRQARALQESEERRLRQLRGSCDGFWEWDLRRAQAYCSPRFAELLGRPPSWMSRDVRAVQALLHPDDVAPARAALRGHLKRGEPYDLTLRMRHADGRWRWLRSRAQADRGADGRELRLSGSISDVTAEHEAREALQRREVLFRSLWETISDGVFIIGTDHVIRFANPAAHALLGHPPGSLVGQPLAVIQPAHLRAGHVRGTERYLRTGKRHLDWHGVEITALHHDGREMPVEVCFSDFELDGERQVVGFLRDISKRREAQLALQDAHDRLEQRVEDRTRALTEANERLREVDRLKSEFLATMSHELRTPLNAILGFSNLLLQDTREPLTPGQRRSLGFVATSGQHLLALINDLLDVSRIESGHMALQPESVDLVQVIDDVLAAQRPAADAKRLSLAREAPSSLPWHGDRRRAYQVLLNLVNNAIKFTDRGQVSARARVEGDEAVVDIEDTGMGIAAHQLGHLFQPFRQLDGSLGRSHEGTGLGLYLCHRLVTLMQGRITLRSEPGTGSVFSVRWPLRQAAETAPTPP